MILLEIGQQKQIIQIRNSFRKRFIVDVALFYSFHNPMYRLKWQAWDWWRVHVDDLFLVPRPP